MIKFYSALLFISFILTYIVSINKEFKIIAIDSPYISNEFCFAIASGILTGLIVALAAELRQYYLNKQVALNIIFSSLVQSYSMISIQKARLKYYLYHKDEPIPSKYSDISNKEQIIMTINQINFVDYSPFYKKEILLSKFNKIKKDYLCLQQNIMKLNNIDICHCKIKIEQLEKGINNGNVNSSNAKMNKVLNQTINDFGKLLNYIDNICLEFYETNKTKYNWIKDKEEIDSLSKKIEEDYLYQPEYKNIFD